MTSLFGTDGIRGVANADPLIPETAVRIGLAIADQCRKKAPKPMVVIGRDTRRSGGMLEGALASGISSAGLEVLSAGVVPTPAVAHLVKVLGTAAGVVISASHNPFGDNGIKVFDHTGRKLSREVERQIEQRLADTADATAERRPQGAAVGSIRRLEDAVARYSAFIGEALMPQTRFQGLRLVVDCANGAMSRIAPGLLAKLGADVTALGTRPDGVNINAGCGSEFPDSLAGEVVRLKADAGLAFDGDGDRLVAVTAQGHVLTGDQVLAILANHLLASGQMTSPWVVSTVMSNMGLSQALDKMGLHHAVTQVGDRNVMEKMLAVGARLGGENSGHTILADHHSTGDGLLTALKLLEAMVTADSSMAALSRVMTVYPQVLEAVTVPFKPDLETLPDVQRAIRDAETQLAGKGRVLVRYSGTQPVCRVMVEAESQDAAESICRDLSQVIAQSIQDS